MLARLQSICKIAVSQTFSQEDLVRLAIACMTNAPEDTIALLFNASIARSIAPVATKMALTHQEYGNLFGVDSDTQEHKCLETNQEFQAQRRKLEQALRGTLRLAPVAAAWGNPNRRASAVLAMHTTTPSTMLSSVIGDVLDSDLRWVEDLAAEIEEDWDISGPSPLAVIDVLDIAIGVAFSSK